MTTPENITFLNPNEVFVFGSNMAGIHGAGAARIARQNFGAQIGVGCGPTGECYAIATKDENLQILPLAAIKRQVFSFLAWAAAHPQKTFLVTQIGCGLAGYTPQDIAPFFASVPDNVVLPESFHSALAQYQ